jgi:tetratricopeptide (TPR) repeat protein
VTTFHLPFLPPEALSDERSIAAAARRAIALAKGGDARAGLNLALQARRRAQGLELGQGELEALNAAATVHLIRGDTIAAVAASMDACSLARRTGNRLLYGHAFVSLKISAYNLGACEDAVAALARCAHEAQELGDGGIEVRARLGLGVVLGDAGRFDAARAEFLKALPLSEVNREASGPSRVISNLANLHRKRAVAHREAEREEQARHELQEAIRVARHARRLAAAEGHLAVEIDALGIEGCAQALAGDDALAHALLLASAQLGRKSRCPTAVVWVLCELGRNRLCAGDLEGARAAYTEALEVAADTRPSRKIAVACAALAEIDAMAGNPVGEQAWRERAADETAQFEIARLQTRRQLLEVLAQGQ